MSTDRTTSADANLLKEIQLARRWQMSRRTLQRWRQHDSGPIYILLGGQVRYRLSDVIAFENDRSSSGTKDCGQ